MVRVFTRIHQFFFTLKTPDIWQNQHTTAFWIFSIYVFTLKLNLKKCRTSLRVLHNQCIIFIFNFAVIFKNSSIVWYATTFWNTIGWDLSVRFHLTTNSKVISIDTWFVFKSNWKSSLLTWNWNIVKFMAKNTFVW